MGPKLSEKCDPIKVFMSLSFLGLIAMMLSLFISGGSSYKVMINEWGFFPDFFGHITRFYTFPDNIYRSEIHASFPPMAYLYYGFLARILKADNSAVQSPLEMPLVNSSIFVLVMTMAVFAALFVIIARRIIGEKWGDIAGVLLLCSYPMLYTIERGNMVLNVLLLLMAAMLLKDSDHPALREAALILIALSASLKMYPAIFGILYIYEKRYKEAARLIVYGILFFFLPFAFFEGVTGLKLFISNISAVSKGVTGVTITGISSSVLRHFFDMSEKAGNDAGRVLSMIYLVIVLILIYFAKKRWQRLSLLSSIMIVFLSESGNYNLIYFAIPLLFWMRDLYEDGGKCGRIEYVHAVMFALIFFGYPIPVLGTSAVLYLFLYLMLLLIMAEVVHDVRRKS